jgi:hypothetical protein
VDESPDWALCLMNNPIDRPYERLNDQAAALRRNGELLLTGFGCHDGSNDRRYRIGEATIDSLPSSDNFIRVRGGAVLCLGDSGGPAFLLTSGENGPRRLAAVNSENRPAGGISLLASVTTASARNFFGDWSGRHGVSICGVTPGAPGCRP